MAVGRMVGMVVVDLAAAVMVEEALVEVEKAVAMVAVAGRVVEASKVVRVPSRALSSRCTVLCLAHWLRAR